MTSEFKRNHFFRGPVLWLIIAFFSLLHVNQVFAWSLDLKKLKETAENIKHASGKMSEEDEIEIGGLVTSNLLGAAPMVDNEALQRYVNNVGRWIALQSERPDLPWKFAVIESNNINAFAAPGGHVVLTKGLFLSLNSEAELAGVLGHEIAHVIQKHHLKALQKNAKVNLLGDALQAAANNNSSKKDQKKLGKIINAGTQLYAKGLDREDEYEADRMGVVYAARAGYDPYALLNVLLTLDSMSAESPQLGLLLKTHPPFKSRIQLLDINMDNRLNGFAGQLLLTDNLVSMQLKLVAK